MEHILTHSAAFDYLTAGKALFTVKNEATGNRFTFKVIKPSKKTSDETMRWVYVLNGPDNGSNYLYIGAIRNGVFNLTGGSKVSAQAPSYQAFAYVFHRLKIDQLDASVSIYHHNRCGKCGHVLTTPESIVSGLGPICQAMIAKGKVGQIPFKN